MLDPAKALFLYLVLAGSTQACGESRSPEVGPLQTDTVGDTIVLRNLRPSEWAHPRGLVLDLLVGDEDQGGPGFGNVGPIGVMSDASFLVGDRMATAVFRFDAEGSMVGTIGGLGEGPGEYRYVDGLQVMDGDTVIIHDSMRRRILVFDSMGEPVTGWQLGALGVSVSDLEVIGNHLAFRIDFEPGVYTPAQPGWIILDLEGTVLDTIGPFPTSSDNRRAWGTFHPSKHLVWHPDGFPVVGVSDAYRFELLRADHVHRVVQAYEPVPVSNAERAAFEVETRWRENRGGRFNERILPPPEYKAAYSRLLVSRTGDLWVFRHGPGEVWTTQDLGSGLEWERFREPLEIDVFDRFGRFRGSIEADGAISPVVVSGDTVWAVLTDEHDQELVGRYLVR